MHGICGSDIIRSHGIHAAGLLVQDGLVEGVHVPWMHPEHGVCLDDCGTVHQCQEHHYIKCHICRNKLHPVLHGTDAWREKLRNLFSDIACIYDI